MTPKEHSYGREGEERGEGRERTGEKERGVESQGREGGSKSVSWKECQGLGYPFFIGIDGHLCHITCTGILHVNVFLSILREKRKAEKKKKERGEKRRRGEERRVERRREEEGEWYSSKIREAVDMVSISQRTTRKRSGLNLYLQKHNTRENKHKNQVKKLSVVKIQSKKKKKKKILKKI